MRNCYADGTRPNSAIVHDEAGHEVLIFAGRHPVLQACADHLVAGPFPSVPGVFVSVGSASNDGEGMGKRDATTIAAVLGRKHIPAVFRGELVAIVDDHSHRGRMRLDQHTRNEVGDEIVAEIVALVGRAPELARIRDGDPCPSGPSARRDVADLRWRPESSFWEYEASYTSRYF
jgi:hypothetical protein